MPLLAKKSDVDAAIALMNAGDLVGAETRIRARLADYPHDVNLQALRHPAPGGWLFTSTCSQHLPRAAFREVVAAAAADAGRQPIVVAEIGQPPAHPVAAAHPEGEYLKSLLLRA